MQRALTIPALLAIIVSLSCSRSESPSQPRAAKEAPASAASDTSARVRLQGEIANFAVSTNADVTWTKGVVRELFTPLQRIYSVDVEEAWIKQQPILFVGHLEDVRSLNDGNYTIVVRQKSILTPNLALEVSCPKLKAQAAVESARADRGILSSGVAVAARISAVRRVVEPSGGEVRTVFIGSGQCIDIKYLGEIEALLATNEPPSVDPSK